MTTSNLQDWIDQRVGLPLDLHWRKDPLMQNDGEVWQAEVKLPVWAVFTVGQRRIDLAVCGMVIAHPSGEISASTNVSFPEYDLYNDSLTFGSLADAQRFAEDQMREWLKACASPLNLRCFYVSQHPAWADGKQEPPKLSKKDRLRMSSWEACNWVVEVPA